MKGEEVIRELFTNGAKLVDELDIYRNIEGSQIHFTNELIKKSAEIESTEKTIKNMKDEISRIESENTYLLDSLRKIGSEIDMDRGY